MSNYNNKFIFYVILIVCTLIKVKAIDIKFMAFSFDLNDKFYSELEGEFNNYSKLNNLGINLHCQLYNNANATLRTKDIANTFDYLSKDNKYDLYTYDTVYSARFKDKFYPLDDLIPKKTIESYKKGTALKTCLFDDKILSLPLYVDYGVLVSNSDLIRKYGRSPAPKTWDELLETAIYVREQEYLDRQANAANITDYNPNEPKLPGYYARISEGEDGTCALIEIIHSFRDHPDDPFPAYTSANAKNSIKKIKQIMNEVSSKDVFKLDNTNQHFDKEIIEKGKFIFARAWDSFNDLPFVTREKLPGKVEGVSASCIGGVNLAINKGSSKEKIEAAAKVIEYLTSDEVQLKLIVNKQKHSGIISLYDPEKYPEVCSKFRCDVFGSMQGIIRPKSSEDYDRYSEKFRDYIYEYLYDDEADDKKLDKILNDVTKLQKIYDFEFISIPGIIIIVLTFITVMCILLSYIYISVKRYRKQFTFLSFNYWCIFLTGLFIISCYPFTGFEGITIYHCKARPIILTIGFTLAVIPFFLKIVTHFPKKNIYSKFVKDHYTLIFIIFVVIDVALSACWYLYGDTTLSTVINIERGKDNYRKCDYNNKRDAIFKTLIFSYKILILIGMALILFTEWNLRSIKDDIRAITSTVYFEVFGLGIFMFLSYYSINDRYLNFGLKAVLIELLLLSVLLIIVGKKVYMVSFKKEDDFPNIYFGNSNMYSSSGKYNSSSGGGKYSTESSRVGNIMSYHFQTEKDVPVFNYSGSNGRYNYSSNNSNHLFTNTISEFNESMNNYSGFNSFGRSHKNDSSINSKHKYSKINNSSNSYSSNIKPPIYY